MVKGLKGCKREVQLPADPKVLHDGQILNQDAKKFRSASNCDDGHSDNDDGDVNDDGDNFNDDDDDDDDRSNESITCTIVPVELS